jgi:hypothetical protein
MKSEVCVIEVEEVINMSQMRTMAGVMWVWIAGTVFGLSAGLTKLLLYPAPDFNPPALYVISASFLLASSLWWLLIVRGRSITIRRGFVAGASIGWATPLLMWLLYGGFLFLSDPGARDAFGWSILYAALMLRGVSWLGLVVGGAIGALLAWLQASARRQDTVVCSDNAA